LRVSCESAMSQLQVSCELVATHLLQPHSRGVCLVVVVGRGCESVATPCCATAPSITPLCACTRPPQNNRGACRSWSWALISRSQTTTECGRTSSRSWAWRTRSKKRGPTRCATLERARWVVVAVVAVVEQCVAVVVADVAVAVVAVVAAVAVAVVAVADSGARVGVDVGVGGIAVRVHHTQHPTHTSVVHTSVPRRRSASAGRTGASGGASCASTCCTSAQVRASRSWTQRSSA
jgi:hypothetical protein